MSSDEGQYTREHSTCNIICPINPGYNYRTTSLTSYPMTGSHPLVSSEKLG